MNQISTDRRDIIAGRYALPVVWAIVSLLILCLGLWNLFISNDNKSGSVAVSVSIFAALFGFFFIRSRYWELVEEVHDCGDSFLIKNRKKEIRIQLSDIRDIDCENRNRHIVFRMKEETPFGRSIEFDTGHFPFLDFKPEIYPELKERIKNQNSNKAAERNAE